MSVAIYIDGANLLGNRVLFKWEELRDWILQGRELSDGQFFDSSGQRWLTLSYKLAKKAGFSLNLSDPIQLCTGEWKQSGVDVLLAITAVQRERMFETFILVSGDSDFLPLVDYLARIGKDVEIVSTGRLMSKVYGKYSQRFLDQFFKEKGWKKK